MLYLNFFKILTDLRCSLISWLTCFTCKIILLLVTLIILGTMLGSLKREERDCYGFRFRQMNSSLARMTRIIACRRAWMNLITPWLKSAAHSAHSRKYVSNSTSITWSRGSSSLLWTTVSYTLATGLFVALLFPLRLGTCSEKSVVSTG